MDVAWTLLESAVKAFAIWLLCLISRKVWDRIMGEKCLILKCQRQSAVNMRGLCLVCYGRAKKMVESGQTSWQELEEMGLSLAASSPFDDAFFRKAFPNEHIEEKK